MQQIIRPQIIGIKETPDSLTVQWGQCTGAILNENDELKKDSDANWNMNKDIKEVARVPRVIKMLWDQLGITNDENELRRALMRNPEYMTTTKRLI